MRTSDQGIRDLFWQLVPDIEMFVEGRLLPAEEAQRRFQEAKNPCELKTVQRYLRFAAHWLYGKPLLEGDHELIRLVKISEATLKPIKEALEGARLAGFQDVAHSDSKYVHAGQWLEHLNMQSRYREAMHAALAPGTDELDGAMVNLQQIGRRLSSMEAEIVLGSERIDPRIAFVALLDPPYLHGGPLAQVQRYAANEGEVERAVRALSALQSRGLAPPALVAAQLFDVASSWRGRGAMSAEARASIPHRDALVRHACELDDRGPGPTGAGTRWARTRLKLWTAIAISYCGDLRSFRPGSTGPQEALSRFHRAWNDCEKESMLDRDRDHLRSLRQYVALTVDMAQRAAVDAEELAFGEAPPGSPLRSRLVSYIDEARRPIVPSRDPATHENAIKDALLAHDWEDLDRILRHARTRPWYGSKVRELVHTPACFTVDLAAVIMAWHQGAPDWMDLLQDMAGDDRYRPWRDVLLAYIPTRRQPHARSFSELRRQDVWALRRVGS